MRLSEYASTRKTRGSYKMPRSVQQSIPIDRIYADGVWQSENVFSLMWQISDINYAMQSDAAKQNILTQLGTVYAGIPADCWMQVCIVSQRMQVFAQPTNVDMSNRLICFNIQSLGEQLKPVAMLSMLEYINTAVMSNERNDPKAATWVYFDEIYLLLRDSLSANFLYTSWKRFRKYNAYATGITQNVQDCLTNDTAYAMLANSEFVVMLRQTKDIDSVVELYGLSEPQRKYLLLAQPGEGIIKMGNSLIPFNNPQPKDTKTYKLLTTKPGEME